MTAFSNILKYKYPLVLFFILVMGSFLRLYEINQQSLWIDEGFTIMQEKSIYAHGYPLLLSGNIEFKDALLPYILSILRVFSGENFLLFRIVSVVFGVASIFIIYFLGKEYFNKNVGLLSAFFLSFSYWHIAWSRQIRSYSLFVFLFLLSLLFYAYYEKSNEKKWLYFLTISMIFSLLAKFSFGIILIMSFLIFLVFRKKVVSCKIIALLIIPMTLAIFLTHRFLLKIFSFLGSNYLKYYTVDYFWEYFGLLFVLAIVGVYLSFSKYPPAKKHLLNLNFFIFGSTLLFFSFFSLINQRRYIFFLTPFIFIYSSYCIWHLARSKKLLFLIIFITIIGIDQLTMTSLNFKPKVNYFLEEYTPQPNFAAAYKYISENTKNEKIISPYPFMDYIYLKKTDYSLPISYTGLPNESSLKFPTEYYTNSPRLFSSEEIVQASKDSGIIVILDDMSISRSDKNMIQFIRENGQLVFEDANELGQKIEVYNLYQQTQ